MEEYRTGPRVILDARFVVQEPDDARHLNALEKIGCVLVLTDAFSYEFGTFARNEYGVQVQRKLMQFPNSIECWIPTAELLKNESTARLPTLLPVDNYATDLTRHWLRTREGFVPDHLDEVSKRQRKQREEKTVKNLLADLDKQKPELDDLADAIGNKPFDETTEIGFRFVNNRSRILAQAMREHGNAFAPEMFNLAYHNAINERWFLYHQAKSYLALLCFYIHKFGTKVTAESIREIEGMATHCDYSASLAFAEGLASNDDQGDLGKLCQWMYGGSRKLITMARIDKVHPQPLDIENAAYYRWEMWGQKHGHDREQWDLAERELHRFLWPML